MSQYHRILYVWLPTERPIYPTGLVTLANHIHQDFPQIEQQILDLSPIAPRYRSQKLKEVIQTFGPKLLAFSWRDVQTFGPHEGNDPLRDALKFYHHPNPLERLRIAPKMLGHFFSYRRQLRGNLKLIRQGHLQTPGSLTVVGGAGFSVFSEEILAELPQAIVGVKGEGEGPLKDILEQGHPSVRLIQGPHCPTERYEKQKLDVDYTAKIFPGYTRYLDTAIGIQSKRGCPHRCSYCIYSHLEGRNIRQREPKQVVSEIESYHRRWGMRRFWFADSQFIPSHQSAQSCLELLEGLAALNLPITWSGYVRTNMIDQKIARAMVQSGLEDLEVSINSGSQQIVDQLKAGFKMEALYQGCRNLAEAGYKGNIILNFSLNAPTETEATLRESVAAYHHICSIFDPKQVQPYLFFLGVQPHTPLFEQLEQSGYFKGIKQNFFRPSPRLIRKMLHNPPPLDQLIARSCLKVWKQAQVPERHAGHLIMTELQAQLGPESTRI
ncbi:MAG: hypothetical protein A2600_12035 [Candidatus Lambdaproteobacteria bacterium RIFOXYD1_FULL_56_27]|uniref:Radical SAM core domain-containing protein n=1 Tax=Candidatus Lambdaproteobacteria bacterium RIFOXYD2_FULL_56_26 TaxID=1817773 RepID=A0A1F6GXB7_9PROT|nr:MAG: hypothetical protein A2426_08900 [Candidatus Lambdaproteobacteria bacterium RIFOXYC1_FULL_56_13]OGH02702.1 MAG: hypothetical protein A2557_11510 [Candidatus Lambdaproteobacteria bacterium RIFOXYD2_FULL_56_26]OGH07977.1 MAG: hypothetical protein A2600_12035 [Candidatus Lambdaproteobacteria bacterium RIFOXYD1_FULL_56_27]